MKLSVILLTACVFVCMSAGYAVADEMTVGGSMKFFLYDTTSGHVMYTDADSLLHDEDQDIGTSAGFNHVIIDFYRHRQFLCRFAERTGTHGDLGRSALGRGRRLAAFERRHE